MKFIKVDNYRINLALVALAVENRLDDRRAVTLHIQGGERFTFFNADADVVKAEIDKLIESDSPWPRTKQVGPK